MRIVRRTSIPGLLAVSILCLSVTSASGADRIYWGNEGGESISHANVSGGGGADIPITGVDVDSPEGLAIDSAAGKIYWANRDGGDYSIRFANLDGSGGGKLNTDPAPVLEPHGLAIYPAAGKIYWANFANNGIFFANLDGTGGGKLDITGAVVEQPLGVAVYPAQNRIYWANFDGGAHDIDFANLDGTGGGGSLDLTGASVDMPRSVAIDASTNRVYWANSGEPGFSFASANGGQGGDLFTDGLSVGNTAGFAIDPMAKRFFWGSTKSPFPITFASLVDGGPLGELDTTGATRDFPTWPVLLYDPRGTAPPSITVFQSPTPRILRKPKLGQPLVPLVASQTKTLNCSQGSWADDLLESLLYRAPQNLSFQWLRNERVIPGATTSTLVANTVGDYVCRVTASNAAGSSAQESAAANVAARLKLGKPVFDTGKGITKVPFATSGTGAVTLSGKGVKPRKQRSKPDSATQLRGIFVLKAKGKAMRDLSSDGKAKVKVKIAFTPTGGTPLQKKKSFSLRLAAD